MHTSLQNTGTLIVRAAGFILILTGTLTLIPMFTAFGEPTPAVSGWTSYSPLNPPNPSSGLATELNDAYFVIASSASFYVPCFLQILAGAAMILLGRPLGRWLARGLEPTQNDGNG